MAPSTSPRRRGAVGSAGPRAEERSLSLGRTESLRTATVEGSWRVRARGIRSGPTRGHMNSGNLAMVVVGVLAVALVLVAIAGGFGGRVQTSGSVSIDVTAPDPDATTWVLSRSHEDGGRSFFGLFKGDSTFRVAVQVRTEPSCVELLGVNRFRSWPAPYPECASDLSASGVIAGQGPPGPWGPYTPLIVELEVTKICYEAAVPGAPYPADCR